MLIIGAKGFAKEVLDTFDTKNLEEVLFFDDISKDLPQKLFDKFEILRDINAAEKYFCNVDNKFTLGIGKPKLRKKLSDRFTLIGGKLTKVISNKATIGNYNVQIESGCNILAGAILSNDVKLGKACIVYYNSIITHDCIIGDFVEISPGAKILGRVKVGSYTHIGAGAIILPDVTIGENVIIGAGSVVTKDVQNNSVIVGVPGRFLRNND